jgi:hypothetical protein
MANVKLTMGARYRVQYSHYRNPFAGLKGVRPTIAVCLKGINEDARKRELRRGEIIVYVGSKTGWGSDPGIEEWFKTEDGFDGALEPSGIWGGVNAMLLTPADG